MGNYVPLWVKSHYSFLEGASSPEELVEQAAALGYAAVAITDRNGLYGLPRAHLHAKKHGIKLLVGAELSLELPRTSGRASRIQKVGAPRNMQPQAAPLVLLAPDASSYSALCRLISRGHTRGKKGECLIAPEDIAEFSSELLALLPHPELLGALKPIFEERLYALCVRHLRPSDKDSEVALREEASRWNVPVVASTEVLYHEPSRRPLQDVITCIREKCTLSTAGRKIKPNAEHFIKSPAKMEKLFADMPDALYRSAQLAELFTFDLSHVRYRYPAEKVPHGVSEHDWLSWLTLKGAKERYGGAIPDKVYKQLKHELHLIDQLDYGGYFLTMHDIVMYCQKNHIVCQGRGSAANSAVCYCLGITAVDPIRMDLLFERFISMERAEPPDIDLDIEHERREEVIQYMYRHYGRRHAAMVANVVRYRTRSAVRDVGKVLELPAGDIDAVAKLLNYHSLTIEPEAIRATGLDPKAPLLKHLLKIGHELLDQPRHLSIHPGGFLLGHQPVDELVPIEPATMKDRTIIQWDKTDVEDLGLFKVDLLGLGALSCIRRSFELLAQKRERDPSITALEMAHVPPEDPDTYAMISAADTMGVFQIESRAQMSMLPRLKPRTFYDLVIEVSIVRPGPIQGDMVHPYLRRRCGLEPVDYPHPSLKKILKKTLGVPIFQEQVMKLAMQAARYSPGEADQLRRDMAAWSSRGRIEQHREKLINRMIESGISPDFAEKVFSQIRGFGEYGFPESHATSFALLAYITAWIKCHHPEVFLAALLNSQPMGFYSPSTLIQEAQRRGVEVRPVDVQHSSWDCTLEWIEEPTPQPYVHSPYVRPVVQRKPEGGATPLHDAQGGRISSAPTGKNRSVPHVLEDFSRGGKPEGGATPLHDAQGGRISSAPTGKNRSVAHLREDFSRGGKPEVQSPLHDAQAGRISSAPTGKNRSVAHLREDFSRGGKPESDPPARRGKWVVRMGLRYVKGLGAAERKLVQPHLGHQWPNIDAFVHASKLRLPQLLMLARAGAFQSFGMDRRDAIWHLRGLAPYLNDSLYVGPSAASTRFAPLRVAEAVQWDYQSTYHSTRGHPMLEIRHQLGDSALVTAGEVQQLPDKKPVKYVGYVICRQRPQTASGVCFFTLEDETGTVNLVVWPAVFEKYDIVVRTASLLGVQGTLQQGDGVTHLIAEHLWVPNLARVPSLRSRDFH